MCLGGSPNAPEPPPRAPEAPRVSGQSSRRGRSTDTTRRRSAAGEGTGTILTGPRGVLGQAGAATITKTLLGR